MLLNVRVRGEEDEATVFLLLLRLLLLLLRINALITKFSDLFLCSQISLSVSRVIYIMVKKYRRRRLCSARASSSRS